MSTDIDATEARVLGSLIEKQLTTPEYYPLTLNALTAACNQKSNREPVLQLAETEILAAIDSLRDKNLVYLFYGSSSRTVKYKHMLPNVFELDPPAVALIALLLLRGPQTVGELRGRSDRLHEFNGLDEVQHTLDALADRSEPLVVRLQRQAGQKEARYAHLLSGAVNAAAVSAVSATANSERSVALPNETFERLESEIKLLRDELENVKAEMAAFKRQFE
jgi:uncharacterized protein YceH (UPF0502 family)